MYLINYTKWYTEVNEAFLEAAVEAIILKTVTLKLPLTLTPRLPQIHHPRHYTLNIFVC